LPMSRLLPMASRHIVRSNQGLLSSTTALCAYLDNESAESKPYELGVLRDCGDNGPLELGSRLPIEPSQSSLPKADYRVSTGEMGRLKETKSLPKKFGCGLPRSAA
ncbi:hypothetical protein, partial [Escherichia coli]|uniref:hypothetical protein n=1 Tax=Escherichia coli TaxID=562 RepID=UPI001BE443DA